MNFFHVSSFYLFFFKCAKVSNFYERWQPRQFCSTHAVLVLPVRDRENRPAFCVVKKEIEQHLNHSVNNRLNAPY